MTNASKTIRKNSKEFNAVMAFTSFTEYSLDNCFSGENVNGITANTKVRRMSEWNGVYTIDVHSNLWYTTTVEAVNN